MKERFLCLTMMLLCITIVLKAGEKYEGIIVTYEGSNVSYKLDQIPIVTYIVEDGVQTALLSFEDETNPAISFALKDGAKLEIVFGIYNPDGIDGIVQDKVSISTEKGRKIIYGGKLIIVGKDGKLYNTNGTLIRN